MMLAPRLDVVLLDLGEGRPAPHGDRYGFVGVNVDGLPYATDGHDEVGLTVGGALLRGFAQYQELGKSPTSRRRPSAMSILDAQRQS